MTSRRALRAMVRLNVMRLRRDRFLLQAGVLLLVFGVSMRWGMPWLRDELLAREAIDIAPYFPLGASYFVLVNASLFAGLLGGLLSLETREERTLVALRVSPVPLMAHLGITLALTYVVALSFSLVQAPILAVGHPGGLAILVAAALGAPTGVIYALLLTALARDKLEAFAVFKLFGIAGLVPIVAFFAPTPWQYVAGVWPPYWACKVWWLAAREDPQWGTFAGAGLGVSALWLIALLRRTLRTFRRAT
ncbi:MAG: hypothetical protein AAGN82_27915 [Myxococcota bacterium]